MNEDKPARLTLVDDWHLGRDMTECKALLRAEIDKIRSTPYSQITTEQKQFLAEAIRLYGRAKEALRHPTTINMESEKCHY